MDVSLSSVGPPTAVAPVVKFIAGILIDRGITYVVGKTDPKKGKAKDQHKDDAVDDALEYAREWQYLTPTSTPTPPETIMPEMWFRDP